MTAQELATSATENIPFVTAILNNGYLGMVRQWQELFFDERYSGVWLDPNVPDYVKLAEAYGAVGLRVEQPDEVDSRDREGVLGHRPQRRDRLPGGPGRDGVPHGALGRLERRHHRGAREPSSPPPTPRRHRSHDNGTTPAHDLGPGGGPARRAHARGRPVRGPRLQHRLARGRAHRDRRASRA